MPDQTDGLLSPWLRKRRIIAARPYLHGLILDYGCGIGVLSEACSPENYTGFDLDEESISIAKARYPKYRFNITIPRESRFDTIALLAVIEHIRAPEVLLKELKSILKPQGTIVLTTPNPIINVLHRIGSKAGLFSTEAYEQHEQLIDFRAMRMIAKNAGLKIKLYKRFLFGANQLFLLGVEKNT